MACTGKGLLRFIHAADKGIDFFKKTVYFVTLISALFFLYKSDNQLLNHVFKFYLKPICFILSFTKYHCSVEIIYMRLLDGKTVLVTGASKGIGRAIAFKYAENGASVAFSYLSSVEKGLALEEELKKLGVNAKGYRSDASDFTAAENLIQSVLADFGNLDVLINNAGITKDGLLMRMSEEQWDEVIRINLKSVFNLTKAAIKTFMKQKSGSIINLTSVVGIRGNAGQANYAASKAGIIGFTKSVALELGSRNIRSNAIAPGFIETEMTGMLDAKVVEEWANQIPMKRAGTADEVANCAVFLGSDLSTYISGQVLQVDGGMLT